MSRETEAAQWYARMRGKDADSARAAFGEWMRDPANAAAYADYDHIWNLTGRLSPAPRARMRAERDSARFAPGGLRWAAAAFGAIALALSFAWYVSHRGDTPQVAAGAILPGQLKLADGTVVTLRDGAWAEPQFTDGERRLRLHGGRARFEVAHDEARPFIVIAGQSETEALGTIFEIDTRQAAPRITLIKGAVEVRLAGGVNPLRLTPGQSAEVTGAGPRRLPAAASTRSAAMLDADKLPLGAVIDRANRANRTPIRLADPALASLQVTGRFDVADSSALARTLAAALDLAVENEAGEITLKRREQKRGG